ncbi:MAG: hypothetical protein ACRAVC_22960 [Trichormus sp.]
MAISASDDHTLKVWDIHTGQLLRTFTGFGEAIKLMGLTSDGKRIISFTIVKVIQT